MSMLPDDYQNTFNKLSTIPMADFHFWSAFLGSATIVLLGIVILALTIFQMQGDAELDLSTTILTLAGLLFAVTGFLTFMAI